MTRKITVPEKTAMWKFAAAIAFVGVFALSSAVGAAGKAAEKPAAATPAALNFKVQSLDGQQVDLARYQGKVILIVNVASKCGLTPQYEKLEAIYQKYKGQDLVILGFPCNQFRGQEPGAADEIRKFCTDKYHVTFPLMAKIEVNGDGTCDLYKYLKSLNVKPKGPGDVSWNFEKFVIGRNGEVVARFQPRTTPDDPAVIAAIESELGKK
jgi:glutathione peroxidase